MRVENRYKRVDGTIFCKPLDDHPILNFFICHRPLSVVASTDLSNEDTIKVIVTSYPIKGSRLFRRGPSCVVVDGYSFPVAYDQNMAIIKSGLKQFYLTVLIEKGENHV